MIQIWYHANCNDGLAAAAVAYTVFGANAKYVPVQYGEHPPEYQVGDHIYIVDFSYKKEVLEEIAKVVELLVVLDHHKTAQKELEDLDILPNTVIRFDMERSGAKMAWDYWQDGNAPYFISLIEDYDLWQFKWEATKDLNAGLQMTERTPQSWSMFLVDEDRLQNVIDRGRVVNQYRAALMEGWLKNVQYVEFAGYANIPLLNCPKEFTSELGNILAEKHQWAILYTDIKENRVFSLRSVGDFDVSDIAKKFGGGGHKNAAGFTLGRGITLPSV